VTTVNEEMSNRNVELNRLNNDLINFQGSTKLATLLLGRDLMIRRFSPQAEEDFDLLTADLGDARTHPPWSDGRWPGQPACMARAASAPKRPRKRHATELFL
jgi:hypothetical protein